jgi:transposase
MPSNLVVTEPEPLKPIRIGNSLSSKEIEQLVAEYRAGATIPSLSQRFGFNKRTIIRHLRQQRAYHSLANPPATEAQVEMMITLYQAGWSLIKVGKRLGFCATTVATYLRKHHIRTRDTRGRER